MLSRIWLYMNRKVNLQEVVDILHPQKIVLDLDQVGGHGIMHVIIMTVDRKLVDTIIDSFKDDPMLISYEVMPDAKYEIENPPPQTLMPNERWKTFKIVKDVLARYNPGESIPMEVFEQALEDAHFKRSSASSMVSYLKKAGLVQREYGKPVVKI